MVTQMNSYSNSFSEMDRMSTAKVSSHTQTVDKSDWMSLHEVRVLLATVAVRVEEMDILDISKMVYGSAPEGVMWMLSRSFTVDALVTDSPTYNGAEHSVQIIALRKKWNRYLRVGEVKMY